MVLNSSFTAVCQCRDDDRDSHIPVFVKGTGGARYYRIPALTAIGDTIIALADKRIDSINDLPGRIDIVSRRSTDGGTTWEPAVTVAANDSTGGYGDAAVVTDSNNGDVIVICAHGNGLWQDSPAHITVIRSRDTGGTWEKPVDINNQLLSQIPGGSASVAGWFASSGSALQLRDGRLMFALVVRHPGLDMFDVYATYSDDGGLTWLLSDTPASNDGDESKIAELADGTLLMSTRNRHKGPRQFAQSIDRGVTWSPMPPASTLPDPACNGDFLTVTADDGREILLQSLPAHPERRTRLSIHTSTDRGTTWHKCHTVVESNSSYSSMTVLPGNHIGILAEEESADGDGFIITFSAIPLERITARNRVSTEP